MNLAENESLARMIRDRKGTAMLYFDGLADMEAKTAITSDIVGRSTSGVLPTQRVPQQIIQPARRTLHARDVLTVVPTTAAIVDFVKVTTDAATATAVADASPKAENAPVLTAASANVATIAAWQSVSKQLLDDLFGLQAYINTALAYAVRKEEDRQVWKGTGSDRDMNGIINQATAFDTTLPVGADGWEYIDLFGRALQQIDRTDGLAGAFAVVHPDILWYLRLFKSGNTGQYIYRELFDEWGVTLLGSTALSATQFLVGNGSPLAAQIHERQEMTVEISYHDNVNFQKNMATIRAECRSALTVQRPGSFITGTLTKSPA